MSAEIWQKLKASIRELRPDLEAEFNSCRDKDSISNFMNKNFPLTPAMTKVTDWKDHMSVKIPDLLTEHKGKDKTWEKKDDNAQDNTTTIPTEPTS